MLSGRAVISCAALPSFRAINHHREDNMTASTAGTGRSVDIKHFFHIAVFLAITFFFGRLEPIPPITPYGMNVLGALIGVVYAWIFIDVIWPSMIGLLAIGLLDIMPINTLFNKGFGDPTVVMMVFIFVFSAVLDAHGVTRWISMWFVSRKCVEGRPWLLTFALLLAIAVLGGLSSATPACVIGWSLMYGMFKFCGYERHEGYPMMMVIGAVFASQLGMSLIPFKSLPLVAISAYEKLSGATVNYSTYMFASFLSCILCLLVFILVGKFLLRPDLSKLVKLDIKTLLREDERKLSGVQKLLFVFLAALVVFMMLPGFLPGDFAIAGFFKKIGNTGICVLLVALLTAIRVNGKSLCPWRTMVNEGVAWPIIFILAFVLPLSGPIADPRSGITAFMLDILNPLFGTGSNITFLVCIGIVGVILTQFINNTAISVALMPVVFSYCTANGMLAEQPVILVTVACCLAFLTPAASSTAAMLHGNEWVTTRAIWKTAPLLVVSALSVVTAVVILTGTIFL